MVRIGGHHEALPWLHTRVFAAHHPLDPFPTEVFALGFELLMDPGTAVGFLGCGVDRLDPDAQGAVGETSRGLSAIAPAEVPRLKDPLEPTHAAQSPKRPMDLMNAYFTGGP